MTLNRTLISFMVLSPLGILNGCKKKDAPPPATESISTDPKMKILEGLYAQALNGDKKSIQQTIEELRHSDGMYSEALCDNFGNLLVKQTKLTMEVLQGVNAMERRSAIW